MHSVLARMRLDLPVEAYEMRKEGNLLEFTIVDGDASQSALEFLQHERKRLKSIEKEPKQKKTEQGEKKEATASSQSPTLHTRPRAQKSLFEFEENSNNPWNPVLDGRDINRQ